MASDSKPLEEEKVMIMFAFQKVHLGWRAQHVTLKQLGLRTQRQGLQLGLRVFLLSQSRRLALPSEALVWTGSAVCFHSAPHLLRKRSGHEWTGLPTFVYPYRFADRMLLF